MPQREKRIYLSTACSTSHSDVSANDDGDGDGVDGDDGDGDEKVVGDDDDDDDDRSLTGDHERGGEMKRVSPGGQRLGRVEETDCAPPANGMQGGEENR